MDKDNKYSQEDLEEISLKSVESRIDDFKAGYSTNTDLNRLYNCFVGNHFSYESVLPPYKRIVLDYAKESQEKEGAHSPGEMVDLRSLFLMQVLSILAVLL